MPTDYLAASLKKITVHDGIETLFCRLNRSFSRHDKKRTCSTSSSDKKKRLDS
ncbi:hypothetical protein LEP1GSC058_2841 [Leptospira fainei serovar Hurstbridge str. BUT 6]|uniref:Uncharacterized protein n=1 Tax=Leptospira fainei serovar Hurstbridge str. BUT 6 TaxID=1193011 RepID=S3UUY3_9LEPT|nr:hypothetical protein LEP1GSC058_2841 [Leptospira fainei serovar Hurstbridge str. BUT 6]